VPITTVSRSAAVAAFGTPNAKPAIRLAANMVMDLRRIVRFLREIVTVAQWFYAIVTGSGWCVAYDAVFARA
jgi:hypothetical protein